MSASPDPNMQCVCGYRRFRLHREVSESVVQRYLFSALDTAQGFGGTPHGTFFGSGQEGVYSLEEATLYATETQLVCESCQRVRSRQQVGQFALFGSYLQGYSLYVVAAGVTKTGCFEVELRHPDGSRVLSAPLTASLEPILPLAGVSPTLPTYDTLPPGGQQTESLLVADLAGISEDGTFEAFFIDRCQGKELLLASVTLETDVTVLHPAEADLGGAPELWLKGNWPAVLPSSQPNSGSVLSIPFDKCDGVLEYDARFGVTPDQATSPWTPGGTAASDWIISTGGTLRGQTPGVSQQSYYEKQLVLSGAVSAVHGYAFYLVESGVRGAIADGFEFQGLYASPSSRFEGFRAHAVFDGIRMTAANGTIDTVPALGDVHQTGWHTLGMASDFDTYGYAILDGTLDEFDGSTVWGDVNPTPGSHTLKARFGDVGGNGIIAYLRNFVVSSPGRFVRPWFRAFTTVASPVLRLYFVSDADASANTLARFKIRYESAGAGSAPHAVPTAETSLTLNVADRNEVVEATFQLANLVPNSPFTFTVERDWAHSEDSTRATVRLLQAVVRPT